MFFFLLLRRRRRPCQLLCDAEATLSYSAGPLCSSSSLALLSPTRLPIFSFLSLTLALFMLLFSFLRLSFYLTPSGISGRSYLFPPPLLSDYNRSPVTYFFRAMTWPLSCQGGLHCSSHPLSYVVALFLPLVSTLFFSWTGGLLSHQNSSTPWFPSYPLKNCCFLVALLEFSLVFAAADTVFC